MTFYMTRAVTTRTTQTDDATITLWKHIADKANWRITQLPNGYYQTEYKHPDKESWVDVTRRETVEGAEQAIDSSVAHYTKKVEFSNGPKVIKTL